MLRKCAPERIWGGHGTMSLARLEREILELHNGVNLRTTLRQARHKGRGAGPTWTVDTVVGAVGNPAAHGTAIYASDPGGGRYAAAYI
jgi:hypothetical protein